MNTVPVDSLHPGSLSRGLYHESGELLLEHGMPLTTEQIGWLRQAGVRAVVELDAEELRDFVLSRRFTKTPLSSLEEGVAVESGLYSETGVRLVGPGERVTHALKQQLQHGGISMVLVERGPKATGIAQVREFYRLSGSSRTIGEAVRAALASSGAPRPDLAEGEGEDRAVRRFQRYDANLTARVKVRDASLPMDKRPVLSADVLNLSRGGMRLRFASSAVRVDDVLDLIVDSADGVARQFTVLVTLVEQRDGAWEAGARFLGVP